jgi:hypothetical protein
VLPASDEELIDLIDDAEDNRSAYGKLDSLAVSLADAVFLVDGQWIGVGE